MLGCLDEPLGHARRNGQMMFVEPMPAAQHQDAPFMGGCLESHCQYHWLIFQHVKPALVHLRARKQDAVMESWGNRHDSRRQRAQAACQLGAPIVSSRWCEHEPKRVMYRGNWRLAHSSGLT